MAGQEKKAQRARLRRILQELSGPDGRIESLSSQIVEKLWAFLAKQRPLAVALYSPIAGEPALGDLAHRLTHDLGVTVHYPLVVGDDLTFHRVASPADLRPGAFGILEPNPAASPETSPWQIDIFLCPGLGFSPDGTRLGRGKGFYDRALAEARPDVLCVGVGFALQCCDHLPSEPHDQRMTHLADEHGVRDVRSGSPC